MPQKIIEMTELARFILSGIAATVGNMTAVWLALLVAPFRFALVAGVLCGFTISLTLSKLVVFRKRSWKHAGGEAVRFIAVYAVGAASYWIVSVIARHVALGVGIPMFLAERGAPLVGASTMLVTSYLGHRFFTFRTHDSSMSDH